MRKIFAIWLCLLTGTSSVLAQDFLTPLRTNPELEAKYAKASNKFVESNGQIFLFEIDMLDIPIVDDFSTNRMKTYEPVVGDSSLLHIDWLADGLYEDSLLYRFDTTYSFIDNNGMLDSFPNPSIEVVFFEDLDNPLTATDTTVVWPIIFTIQVVGQGTTMDTLFPDALLRNDSTRVFVVEDDDFSLWVNDNDEAAGQGAFINQTFGFQPPNVGVATFDGLDPFGQPYDPNFSGTQSTADTLMSKPINLERDPVTLQPYSDVFFSFFYQSQGFGDTPEQGDSLTLQFYEPENDRWSSVWGVDGDGTLSTFEQVFIPITASRFLREGFRFRFINYATLSGSLDHWSIDYIRLGDGRSDMENDIVDVGFMRPSPSFIQTYTSMPWKHFVQSPSSYLQPEVEHRERNLDDDNRFVSNDVQVFDQNGNMTFDLNPSQIVSSVGANSIFSFPLNLDTNNNPFPVNNDVRSRFTVVNSTTSAPDVNNLNDTVRHEQVFDTYYAYDDGTAEKGYSLRGAGAQLAYGFNLPVQDTLKALQMYFPPIVDDVRLLEFQITVWRRIGDSELILYQGPLVSIGSYSGLNEFVRFELEEEVPIPAGPYFVGWKQLNSDDIFLGFDMNTNNQDKIWFNVTGVWRPGTFAGSLMLRPDFGEPPMPPSSIADELNAEPFQVSLFPNPARDHINVEVSTSPNEVATMVIYDMQGRAVQNERLAPGKQIDISALPGGIYLVRVASADGRSLTSRKLLINR